jgi:aspartate racemase
VSDRIFIHNTIFDELGKNVFRSETKATYIEIINRLTSCGARGIILGCTEIPLLIRQEDSPVPVFDTAFIHANAAVELALNS